MTRTSGRQPPDRERVLRPACRLCPACGSLMRIRYENHRTLVTLTGSVRFDDIFAQVPALQVAPAQLKAMQLSAPERYLLSRIDGAHALTRGGRGRPEWLACVTGL